MTIQTIFFGRVGGNDKLETGRQPLNDAGSDPDACDNLLLFGRTTQHPKEFTCIVTTVPPVLERDQARNVKFCTQYELM